MTMSAIEFTNLTPRQVHQSLLDRFTDFRRHVRSQLLLEGAARLFAATVLLAFLSFALDRVFRLSLPARMAMVVAAGITLCVIIWRELISPMRLKLDPLTLAAALDRISGRGDGFITSRVGTVLELPGMLHRTPRPSPAMLHQAAAACHAALADIDFDARLDERRTTLAGGTLFLALLLPVIFATAAPVTTRLWAARVLGGSNIPWPQKTYLQVLGVENGVIVVPRGEPYVLRVQATADSQVIPQVVSIRFREGNPDGQDLTFKTFGKNDFRYEFSSITSPIEVEITGGDSTMGPITLRPADRPRITDLKLVAQHPRDKEPASYAFNGETDLSFLPRTHLQLSFVASTPIAEAHLKSSTTQPAAADLKQLDDTHFSIEWTHNAADNLEINLVSRDAHLAAAPTLLAIGLKTDQPPRITLAYSGVKLRVTAKAHIPLTVEARDDYGLASAMLNAKTETPDPNTPGKMLGGVINTQLFGPANPAVETEIQSRPKLELEPLKLVPGSLITVNASATDDCFIGPQTTTSRAVTFRVVAPEELFREILLRQQAERAKFRKQADEVRDMRGAMNLVTGADSVVKLAQRHRAVQHEVNRITTALAESLTEMKNNQLGTDEAYQMMQSQVLNPLQALNEELLNPQKDALDGLQPTDTAALAAIESRQDDTFARMNQILHQMSQWDSFVDVLNQLNEVIKLQDAAERKTAELKKKQNEDIFDK
jgi:hypothetical protein